ncbi:MAG: UvrD-helicase domain-containing protein [Gracilimonas sp.]|nr:UvrD-helicase domain-containing protein [Gracilimonas sp.]
MIPDVRQISLGDEEVSSDYFDGLEDGIQYKEYVIIKKGIISHDELLIVANHLFKTYPKLCHILQDKFDYILVDEYRDTNELVIEILWSI